MRINIDNVYSELESLPGCSQIAVSHSLFVPLEKRKQGLASSAHPKKLEYIKELGYDVAMCTVNMSNETQYMILVNNGWQCVHTFVSGKTGNTVGIYIRDLTYNEPVQSL